MQNFISSKYFKYILSLFFSALILISCKDDSTTNPIGEAPQLPPASTFKMDFDSFPASAIMPKTSTDSTNKSNWYWASFNGVVWQTLVTAGMAIPVAAFVESFNHDPQQIEEGKWLWTYEFTPLGGIKHTASLYGILSSEGVNWEMYITKENVYSDFLWYTGESDLLATHGTWTLFFEPFNPTPWIEIEWERNIQESTANIKYTNIIPNAADNGGYIYYGITDDLDYDAFYEILNKAKENTISIKWNRTSHEGRV
ncbi:MAG: hypothetical protein KDC52_02265, partial [Ignavibacteriae bacterium]|nr:hypothetical protein [Ignavibacteriota bacterium]